MGSGSQYGITFIPPYFVNYTADPVTQTTGRNSNLYLPTSQYPNNSLALGIGDHGYVGAPTPPPNHVENSNVLFHHGIEYIHNGAVVNPFTALGDGGFTSSITNGQGVPWKSEQGVQDLWQEFFRSYYQISELEWNTETIYYHYLFGRFLSDFVMTFLPAITTIYDNAILSTDDDYAMKLDFANSQKATFPLIETLVFADSATTTNLNSVYSAIQTTPDDDPQKWFLGNGTTPTWHEADPETLKTAWQLYLQASEIGSMAHSAYLWSYREILRMLSNLQSTLESQSGRLLVLGNAQEAAVNASQNVTYFNPANKSDGGTITGNMYKGGYLESYKTAQQITGQYSSQQSSTLSGANNAINEQNSLMETIMQQMGGLLQGIFNR